VYRSVRRGTRLGADGLPGGDRRITLLRPRDPDPHDRADVPGVGQVHLADQMVVAVDVVGQGISEIVLGAELRQTEHNAHRIMEQAALASSWSAPGSARGGE